MDALGFAIGCGAGIGIEIGAAFLVGTEGLSDIGVDISTFISR
jgi:hypothetical protein